MKQLLFVVGLFSFLSCGGGAELSTVDELALDKYAGTWYEIVRLPNSFEKGLSCVTATYSLRDDGKVKVVNRGVKKEANNKLDEIEGVAWVPSLENPGQLKVQFFWPFAGDYFVFYRNADYTRALVGSPSRKYFWLLSKDKSIAEVEINELLSIAKKNGFAVEETERIAQDCPYLFLKWDDPVRMIEGSILN